MLFTWYLLPQKSVKRSRCSDTKKTICKQNIWQDRTEIITYINTFLSGRESVSFVYICIAVGGPVIKRVGLWSSYQEGRDGIPLTGLTPPHCCICLKPISGFPTSHVVVFFVFSELRREEIVCFVDIGGINDHSLDNCLLISSIFYKFYHKAIIADQDRVLIFRQMRWYMTISDICQTKHIFFPFK